MTQTSLENRSATVPLSSHQFVLVLQCVADLSDEDHDALHEAGCDDAVLGRVDGTHYLDFDRKASSRTEAVHSAIRDVESVFGVGACRLQPDGSLSHT